MRSVLRVTRESSHIIKNFKKQSNFLFWLIACGIVTLLILYRDFIDGVFAQDDPLVLDHYRNQDSSFFDKVFSPFANRWRPIVNVMYIFVAHLVGNSYTKWFLISVVILVLISTYIAFEFYKRNSIQSITIAMFVLTLTSRFNSGILINYAFLVESLSLVFLALLLLKFLDNWESNRFYGIKLCIPLYFALILTHERFVGLNLFFLAYFILHNHFEPLIRLKYLTLFSIPTVMLFAIKAFILKIPIFVGTGTSSGIGFSIATAILFFLILIAGLLGTNVGLEYLHGYIIQNQSIVFKVASLLLLLSTLKLMLLWIFGPTASKGQVRKHLLFSRAPIVYLSLFLSLAIPVISTIRIESRWLYPIYVIFIYSILSKVAQKRLSEQIGMKQHKNRLRSKQVQRNQKKSVLFNLFVALNVFLNFAYTQNMNMLYFVRTQEVIKSQLDTFTPHYSTINADREKVYFLDPKGEFDLVSFESALRNNRGIADFGFTLIKDLAEITNLTSDVLIFEVNPKFYNSGLQVVNAAERSISIEGNYFSDSWSGKAIVIKAIPSLCKRLKIDVFPSDWDNSFVVSNGQTSEAYEISDKTINVYAAVNESNRNFAIVFEKTYIPFDIGLNDDRRQLSHRVSANCLNS